jgi:hypothetical protein
VHLRLPLEAACGILNVVLGEFNFRHFSDLSLAQRDEPPGDIDTN